MTFYQCKWESVFQIYIIFLNREFPNIRTVFNVLSTFFELTKNNSVSIRSGFRIHLDFKYLINWLSFWKGRLDSNAVSSVRHKWQSIFYFQ